MIYGFDRDYITHGVARADLLVPDYWNMTVGGVGRGWPVNSGTPIVGRQKNTGRLNDMFLVSTACGVNERLKDVIESVEPGVHQFLPMLMLQRNNKPFVEKYFMLNICETFEADIFPDLSKRVFIEFHSPFDQPRTRYYDGDRVFSRPRIAGRHLWVKHPCACGSGGDWIGFMSEQMYSAWTKAKIKYFDHRCYKNGYAEVDLPWVAEEQIPEAVAWFKEAIADMKAGRENLRVRYLARRPAKFQHWLKHHFNRVETGGRH